MRVKRKSRLDKKHFWMCDMTFDSKLWSSWPSVILFSLHEINIWNSFMQIVNRLRHSLAVIPNVSTLQENALLLVFLAMVESFQSILMSMSSQGFEWSHFLHEYFYTSPRWNWNKTSRTRLECTLHQGCHWIFRHWPFWGWGRAKCCQLSWRQPTDEWWRRLHHNEAWTWTCSSPAAWNK